MHIINQTRGQKKNVIKFLASNSVDTVHASYTQIVVTRGNIVLKNTDHVCKRSFRVIGYRCWEKLCGCMT